VPLTETAPSCSTTAPLPRLTSGLRVPVSASSAAVGRPPDAAPVTMSLAAASAPASAAVLPAAPAMASSAAAGRPPDAASASATLLSAAPASASSVVPVGRAPVSVQTGAAVVVALASALAAGSHPVSDFGAGRRDQHAVFAVQRRASLCTTGNFT